MSSTFTFSITNAGLAAAAAAQVGGPKITITTVKLGSAVGYSPAPTDTNLHGTIVYTGSIFDYRVDSANQVSYTIRLDQSVGNFNFGEVGLYLSTGELFALAALNTVQEKVKADVTSPGNVVSFVCRLALTNIAPTIQFVSQTLNNAKIVEIANPTAMSLASDLAAPNAYSIQSGDDGGNPILALRQSAVDLWGLSTHTTPVIRGFVEAGTTSTTLISSAIGTALTGLIVSGRYMIQWTTGNRQSWVRHVDTAGTNTITFADLAGTPPNVGDQFIIYQSNYSMFNQINAAVADALDTSLINAILFGG